MTSSRSRRNRSAALLFMLIAAAMLSPTASAGTSISAQGMPSSADAGQPIHVEVRVVSDTPVQNTYQYGIVLYYLNPATVQEGWIDMNLTEGNLTDGTWSCDIPAQSWAGELRCDITVENPYARYPVSGYHTIDIVGEDAPKPFPWNIVVIVGFLAAVLIFTELAFKPGLYRQTGREKVRELEEEDRLRDEEDSERGNEN